MGLYIHIHVHVCFCEIVWLNGVSYVYLTKIMPSKLYIFYKATLDMYGFFPAKLPLRSNSSTANRTQKNTISLWQRPKTVYLNVTCILKNSIVNNYYYRLKSFEILKISFVLSIHHFWGTPANPTICTISKIWSNNDCINFKQCSWLVSKKVFKKSHIDKHYFLLAKTKYCILECYEIEINCQELLLW